MNCRSVQHQHVVREQVTGNDCQLNLYRKVLCSVDALRYIIPERCCVPIDSAESNDGVGIAKVRMCHNWRNLSCDCVATSSSTEELTPLQMLLIREFDARAVKYGEHQKILDCPMQILRAKFVIRYEIRFAQTAFDLEAVVEESRNGALAGNSTGKLIQTNDIAL